MGRVVLLTCKVEDCNQIHHGLGLCSKHYRRLRANGTTDRKTQVRGPECSVEDCKNPVHGKGLCAVHTMRLRRNGTLDAPQTEEHLCLECGKKAVAFNLCHSHYQTWWRGRVEERYTIPTRPWLIAHESRTGILHMQSWVLVHGKRKLVAGCNLRLTLNPKSKRRGTKPCLKCRYVLKEHGLLD